MKVVMHEGQDWVETYVRYGGDEHNNYFVWTGSRTMGVYRFIKLPKSIKRSIHITDIPTANVDNDPF